MSSRTNEMYSSLSTPMVHMSTISNILWTMLLGKMYPSVWSSFQSSSTTNSSYSSSISGRSARAIFFCNRLYSGSRILPSLSWYIFTIRSSSLRMSWSWDRAFRCCSFCQEYISMSPSRWYGLAPSLSRVRLNTCIAGGTDLCQELSFGDFYICFLLIVLLAVQIQIGLSNGIHTQLTDIDFQLFCNHQEMEKQGKVKFQIEGLSLVPVAYSNSPLERLPNCSLP